MNMNTMQVLLWVALPYVCAAVFIVGHIWRYRYDKFGWTTRSSQSYENRLLRWGSPMFHLGILMVIAGHVVGLLIPREWLYAIGISEEIYHIGATVLGTFAAVLTLAGLAILVFRRRTVPAVFLATTVMDKIMYVFLGLTLFFGTLGMARPALSGTATSFCLHFIVLCAPQNTMHFDVAVFLNEALSILLGVGFAVLVFRLIVLTHPGWHGRRLLRATFSDLGRLTHRTRTSGASAIVIPIGTFAISASNILRSSCAVEGASRSRTVVPPFSVGYARAENC